MKRTLRSRSVRLSLMGGAAFALAACDEPQDLSFFENVEQCLSAAAMTEKLAAEDCDAAFAGALAEHAVMAPRYDDLALCEEQHGEGACAVPAEAGGAPDETVQAGGSFMPLFMGYMIGSAMSRNAGMAARPVYRSAKGGWFSSTGSKHAFTGPGSTVKGVSSNLRTPALGAVAAPMSRATVTKAGGFGAARSAAYGGSRSGFGG